MAHQSTSDSTPVPSPLKDRTEHDRAAAVNGIADRDEDRLLLWGLLKITWFGERRDVWGS